MFLRVYLSCVLNLSDDQKIWRCALSHPPVPHRAFDQETSTGAWRWSVSNTDVDVEVLKEPGSVGGSLNDVTITWLAGTFFCFVFDSSWTNCHLAPKHLFLKGSRSPDVIVNLTTVVHWTSIVSRYVSTDRLIFTYLGKWGWGLSTQCYHVFCRHPVKAFASPVYG